MCIESITRKVIRTHKNSRRLIFVSSFIFVCVKILKSSRGILQPRKTVCSTSGTIQFKRPRATIERRRTKEEGTERIMRNEPSGKLLILISRSRWIESAKTWTSLISRDTRLGCGALFDSKKDTGAWPRAGLKATFKFRRRGTAKLPGKRHGAKTSILSIREADGRFAWRITSIVTARNPCQLAGKSRSEGRAIRPAIKSIKKDLRPRLS